MTENRPPRIYLSPPEVYPGDREAVLEAFDSGWIAPVGPAITRFEQAFEHHMGGGYALALSSGTAALHLAFIEMGVQAGDRVFCSTLSFVASANAIRYCGAEPVFIDSDTSSWNMDPNCLAEALAEAAQNNALPVAVEVVHAYGQCADMESIKRICLEYEVPIIEDAAEALGATCAGKPAGSHGCMSAFSFNGNKLITSSGGGMLWSEDASLIEHARYLSTQAKLPNRGYLHEETGYNYRMSNLLAALGDSQLSVLQERIQKRRDVFKRYQDCLSGADDICWMPEAKYGRATRWLSCLTLKSSKTAAVLLDTLEAENIEARSIWNPLHRQPLFSKSRRYGGIVAEDLADYGLSLPSSGLLSCADQDRVVSIVQSVLASV